MYIILNAGQGNKLLLLFFVVIMTYIIGGSGLRAENGQLHLSFIGGLAVPNDKVSQFYNDSRQYFNIDAVGGIGSYVTNKAASLGYVVGIKGRLALINNLDFVPAIGLTRFNEGDYDMTLPVEDVDWNADIKSVTNVVNIGAGLNLYILKSLLSPYLTASLNYDYISYSCDYVWRKGITVPITTTSKGNENSIGYAIGAGLDIDIKLFSLNVEAQWHTLNIIKTSNIEPNKNHVTFTVGVVF